MAKKSKKIKIREISPKIKEIKESSENKKEKSLENEVEESSSEEFSHTILRSNPRSSKSPTLETEDEPRERTVVTSSTEFSREPREIEPEQRGYIEQSYQGTYQEKPYAHGEHSFNVKNPETGRSDFSIQHQQITPQRQENNFVDNPFLANQMQAEHGSEREYVEDSNFEKKKKESWR